MVMNITSKFRNLNFALYKKSHWKVIYFVQPASIRYATITMTKLAPPDDVRGMKQLERDKFDKTFQIPSIKLKNEHLATAVKGLKKYLLKLDNFKPIQNIDDNVDSIKIAYLDPLLVQKWSDFNPNTIDILKNIDITEDCLKFENLTLKYENWKSDQIFNAILPLSNNNLTGFSTIGHIVHLNIRDYHLDYKNIIGAVLLDKIKNCKTVVNKTKKIDNTYRNFSLELLCGLNNFVTQTKENKCTFEFDFSKVYWNPRLSTEHERITNKLNSNDILFDIFAGVGPFAIPAAKKQCLVFANDLNPDSVKWLNQNTKLNNIKNNLKSFNMDGKQFIENILYDFITKEYINYNQIKPDSVIHITMNLPAIAVKFLHPFVNLCINVNEDSICKLKIIVHVYCFIATESKDEALELVNENIGFDLTDKIDEIIHVRSVSPNKEMMRVSFNLTPDMLFGRVNLIKRKCDFINEDEPNSKSIKS